MSAYKRCSDCGANLDPNEICDCKEEKQMSLWDIPDHPDIRSAELTGYPVNGQPRLSEDTYTTREEFARDSDFDLLEYLKIQNIDVYIELVERYVAAHQREYDEWRSY